MKAILSSKWEIWILFAGFALVCIGVFLLGQWTATQTDNANFKAINQTNNANFKAIYDQGFTAGVASGMNQMQNQCDAEVAAIGRNCEKWENPNLRFGNLNLSDLTRGP